MPVKNFSKIGHSNKICPVVFAALGISLFSFPAQAGFQWAPPAAPPPAQAPAPEILSPSPSMMPSSPEAVTPTVISPPPAPSAVNPPLAPSAITPQPAPPPQIQGNQAPEVISPIVIEGQSTPPASSAAPVPLEQAVLPPAGNLPPSPPLAPMPDISAPPVALSTSPNPEAPTIQAPSSDTVVIAAPSNASPSAPMDQSTAAPQMPAPPSDNVAVQTSPSAQDLAGLPPASPPPAPIPSMPAAPEAGASAMPAPDAVVQGFANNVPLAVALREVLPTGYGFSIDQDVDLATLASFQGGKPWRETLVAMLQPAGLTMREEGVMVAIGHTQNIAAVQAPPPEAPAAAPPPPLDATPVPPPAPPPQEVAVNNGPSLSPPGYIQPTSAGNEATWGGKRITGSKPLLTQPQVPSLPPPAPPPLVSTLRVASSPAVDTWTAARGDTLHKVLETWSRRAHAEFQWSAEYDYPLQASISFTGTFEDAVRSLLSGFEEAHPQPVAELHDNSEAGQMVLVVQTRGNSYTD